MKKELTIEHLAAYLPYGLKFKSGHFLVGLYNGNSDATRPLLMSETENGPIDWEANFNMDKPILRPLSDLTREITHNGETFVPIEVLRSEHPHAFEFYSKLDSGDPNDLPYSQMKRMLEWHFDLFSLCEDGLAIDINTIKK